MLKKIREHFKKLRKHEAIMTVIQHHHGGIYKRLDEGRELLETIKKECPEMLGNQFWIEGWLKSQDQFILDLIEASEAKDRLVHPGSRFPRPWPGSKG